jgi:hypothetical protein
VSHDVLCIIRGTLCQRYTASTCVVHCKGRLFAIPIALSPSLQCTIRLVVCVKAFVIESAKS